MQWMREELEDLAFRVLNPEARKSIIRRFITLQRETGDVIAQDHRRHPHRAGQGARSRPMSSAARRSPIRSGARCRKRSWPSRASPTSTAFGSSAARVGDCYRILGAIHQRWRAVPGRFKDYISQPKSNGYRSIHTTVSGRDGKRVEVQIRTRQMHEVAETGVAAHWSYRDGERVREPLCGRSRPSGSRSHDRAVRRGRTTTSSSNTSSSRCIPTRCSASRPKGDVVKLPRGATPIDFAYAIHTRIGDMPASAPRSTASACRSGPG